MSDSNSAIATPAKVGWFWPALLVGSFFIAYAPMVLGLLRGPWQTEQESHGPLVIAVSLWLVWQSADELKRVRIIPAPFWGWSTLILGLALLFLARNQELLGAEMLSAIAVITGCVLLLAGTAALRSLAFPIAFLLFAVPLSGWMIDAATVPLKVFISDSVTRILYAAGYPIAQNGVMIIIGPYELLVRDACSGMNSIIALAAIGGFYVYAFHRHSKIRSLVLLAAVVPIAIAANFIRVLILVLIAYHGGIETLSGPLHALTGLGLFVVAVLLLAGFDGLLGLGVKLIRSAYRRSARRHSRLVTNR